MLGKSIFAHNDEHKSKERYRLGWRLKKRKKKPWYCNFYRSLLSRAPQVPKCLTAWVPKFPLSARIPSAWVPMYPGTLSARVPKCPLNSQMSKMLEWLENTVCGKSKVPLECSLSAPQKHFKSRSALRVNGFQNDYLISLRSFKRLNMINSKAIFIAKL